MLTSGLNCCLKICANLIFRMPLNVFDVFVMKKIYVSIRIDLHYTFICTSLLQDLPLRRHHIKDLHHQIDFESINLQIIRIEMSLMCENVIFFVSQHKRIVIFSNFISPSSFKTRLSNTLPSSHCFCRALYYASLLFLIFFKTHS